MTKEVVERPAFVSDAMLYFMDGYRLIADPLGAGHVLIAANAQAILIGAAIAALVAGVIDEFGLSRQEARELIRYWAKTYPRS